MQDGSEAGLSELCEEQRFLIVAYCFKCRDFLSRSRNHA